MRWCLGLRVRGLVLGLRGGRFWLVVRRRGGRSPLIYRLRGLVLLLKRGRVGSLGWLMCVLMLLSRFPYLKSISDALKKYLGRLTISLTIIPNAE